MKNIELTEDHKSKLLEMCKELFPEYKEIYFGIDEYDNNFNGFIYFAKNKLPCKNIIEIHWFEFCMTHLIRKIDNLHSKKILKPLEDKACKEGYPDNWLEIWNERPWIKLWSLTNSGTYKKHPVNYLYEQFLKLK